MKRDRSLGKRGVAVLAGGLAFVGTADATELITDGSFENTTPSSSAIVKIGGKANPGLGGGWSTFSTYLYTTLYTMPGPTASGLQYLRPYPSGQHGITQSSGVITQLVSLTATTTLTPAKIDSGQARYTMSAWFSSYRTDNDYSDLTLQFLDDLNAVVGDPVAIGGADFVANLPMDANAKYSNAKVWGQDSRDGTIPMGARLARVTIASTAFSGSPDGYVDLVSLDAVDAAAATPTVASAVPQDNAANVGPVVNLDVTLQDRSTAVNTNSIQLFLDSVLVSPSIQKVDTNTFVHFAAGLLPALSPHTYQIIFADNGTPPVSQTNQFRFTVADYLTLPASLGSPLGSEDISRPGFDVGVYQVDNIIDTPAVQINLPPSTSFSEAVLAGLAGPNVADLTSATNGNTFAVDGFIDWINSSGTTANFPNDQPFPGIPGPSGSEDSFVDEIKTFIRFPAAGYYQMGVNNEDPFVLTAATNGFQRLQITGPTNSIIPSVAIATNITQLQFGGALPISPLTASVAYATPSGNPDDACLIGINANAALAGKIVLLDIGGTNCDSAFKAEQAQIAGAVAVLETTPGDLGFPYRIGDINTNIHIPVLVIAENFGGSLLKSYLTNGIAVSATIRGDPSPTIAVFDGPKDFGAVDVTAGFAVPVAGIYPMRLVASHDTGRANLEWFSIEPDGTRLLVNDTSNTNALRAFRARAVASSAPVFNVPTISAAGVSISWTGTGTLEETSTLPANWITSPNQTNPQTVPATGAAKFYRIHQ